MFLREAPKCYIVCMLAVLFSLFMDFLNNRGYERLTVTDKFLRM
jgi:hypothetical protein